MKNIINYGQHLLIDNNIIKRFIELAEITKNQIIIEIGPGEGAVTEHLCKLAKSVICYEVDKNMKTKLDLLSKKYSNLKVFYENFLKSILKNVISLFLLYHIKY